MYILISKMLEAVITLSIISVATIAGLRKIRNKIFDIQNTLNDLDGFCRQQVDINNLLVEELVDLKREMNTWDNETQEVDVTDLVASMDSNDAEPCPGNGRHQNTSFGGTKEMEIIDHKWS